MGKLVFLGSATLHLKPISKQSIAEMYARPPRRFSLAEYRVFHGHKAKIGLNPPRNEGEDWNLAFPFKESFTTAFDLALGLEHIDFRSSKGAKFTYTFLKDVKEQDIQNLQRWLSDIEQAVGIKDCLGMSFAMDYERELGSPKNPQSRAGHLRSQAKTYGRAPTSTSMRAADELADLLVSFVRAFRAYDGTDVVAAVPPSNPEKPFDLPTHLAGKLADAHGWVNGSSKVQTTQPRAEAKGIKVEDKLAAVEGTIEVDQGVFKNKIVTLVDDLYQSGITMNYVGMLIQQAGAKAVFGLACEKTLRNDHNVQDR